MVLEEGGGLFSRNWNDNFLPAARCNIAKWKYIKSAAKRPIFCAHLSGILILKPRFCSLKWDAHLSGILGSGTRCALKWESHLSAQLLYRYISWFSAFSPALGPFSAPFSDFGVKIGVVWRLFVVCCWRIKSKPCSLGSLSRMISNETV